MCGFWWITSSASPLQTIEHLLHLENRVDVVAWGEPGAHSVHGKMGGAEVTPFTSALSPLGRSADGEGEPPFYTDGRGRPARVLHVVAHATQNLPRLVAGLKLREPAVGDLGHALEHGLGHAAEPHRNGALDWERIDAGAVEVVVGALEGHDRLGPQLAHDRDLLGDAPAPGVEVLVQRLVLDVVPADADPQTQTPGGEDVHRRGLLGHQRGLALGEDDDAGHQLQPLGAGPEIAEKHEGLVERALIGVGRAAPQLVEALQLGAEHVVEDEQVIVAGSLGCLRVVADHRGVRADLRLRKHYAESHGRALSSVSLRSAASEITTRAELQRIRAYPQSLSVDARRA